jgi:hypothetical protein
MLYEVALIEMPTEKEMENGVMEKIILAPTSVIAKDERSAAVIAVMNNKDKITGNMDRVQVLCRPFAI